ncbi:hypothetical protein Tco_0862206 [Tanacetum coccineum]
MSTLAEFMIVVGADNRPPMLDKPHPLFWPTVEQEDGTVRLKTYEELSDKEKLQADCDLKATNIVFKQERECKLYGNFDKFSHVKDETLHQYYLQFAQLINDMNIIQMTMQPAQHEAHANKARLIRGRFPDPLALVPNYHQPPSHFNNYHSQYTTPYAYPPPTIPQQPQVEFPQIDSGLVVIIFLPGDDLIACMNKATTFLSAVFSPRYPSTNTQLRSSSNLRNQATVQDGRVTVQQVQGRQGQNAVDSRSQGDALAWFKEKVLLVQAQAEGKELDEEQLAFLADPRVADD